MKPIKPEEESMKYEEETEKEIDEIDEIQNVYQDPEALIDDDEIDTWEEGFMQGYAQA